MIFITVREAHRRLQENRGLLVDVRENKEWDAGHVDGARHVPLSGFDPTSFDPTASYMLICRSGGRSAKAVELLHAAGLEAVNVDGGMLAWAAEGLPMRCDNATTPAVIDP